MSYANRVLGSIPYGTLIGAPLTAAVQAQALAAQSSIDFIRSVGFTTASGATDPAEFGDIRMVSFSYEKRNNDSSVETVELRIPILSIVPIPYLRIDELTIDFTSKITEEMVREDTSGSTTSASSELNAGYSNFLSPLKIDFKAAVSTKHSSSSSTNNRYKTEHTININVRAVQDDVPGGMGRILEIFESAIG